MKAALVLPLAVLSACFTPTFPEGVLCTVPDRRCPGDQVCAADDRCYNTDPGPVAVDAAVGDTAGDANEGCEPLVAFTSEVGGVVDLFVSNLSGGVINLSEASGVSEFVRNPRWSPDGARLLFDSGDDIWVINRDGTGLRNLTQSAGSVEGDGQWSPNGTQVAFRSGVSGEPDFDIFLIGVTGLDSRPLVNDDKNQNQVVWSNDGGRLVYDNLLPAGVRELRVVRVTGSGDTLIASGVEPRVSPVADVVAFQAPSTFADIQAIDIGGVSQVNLTNSGNVLERDHVWSQDGTKIAWASFRDGDLEIYSMNADGSNPVNLSQNGARELFPSWSGGGTTIAFQSDRNGAQRIWLMNRDGSDPRRLTTSSAVEAEPVFSPCVEGL